MKRLVEVVEFIVGNQYIFFTSFHFAQVFFSGKLIRKTSYKSKIKRIQKI